MIGNGGDLAGGKQAQENEFFPDVFHALSQPVTALECGLELSLLHDSTVDDFCRRIESLLDTARDLRRQFTEFRALEDAAECGDTSIAVALDELLAEVRESLVQLAEERNVTVQLESAPALVHGNYERLRSGFFRLLDFVVSHTATGESVTIAVRTIVQGMMVQFRSTNSGHRQGVDASAHNDFGLRIAFHIFRAAGGSLEIRRNEGGEIVGLVKLQIAQKNTNGCVAVAPKIPPSHS
jgi:signal transduction histidine kinase